MKLKNINIASFLSFFLTSFTTAFAQPCGPNQRLVDRQVLTAGGDILLLRTEFNGGLMDVFNNNKEFELNYVLISKKGEIKKDISLHLTWNERHYNFISCKASYRQPGNADYGSTKENNCAYYSPFSQNNNTILEYYLCGDRKFAYEILINKKGKGKWILYDLDTIGPSNMIKYYDDFTKHIFFKSYLEKKYQELSYLPGEQFEFLNEMKKVKILGKNIELTKQSSGNKWTIAGEKWKILLDGNIFSRNQNPPLINIKENIAYITVFNEDLASCPGYGQDIFPITYAINIKKGEIIWKQEIKYK